MGEENTEIILTTTGEFLVGSVSCAVGGNPGSVINPSSNEITCIVPAGSGAAQEITVSNNGKEIVPAVQNFTYASASCVFCTDP